MPSTYSNTHNLKLTLSNSISHNISLSHSYTFGVFILSVFANFILSIYIFTSSKVLSLLNTFTQYFPLLVVNIKLKSSYPTKIISSDKYSPKLYFLHIIFAN